SRSSPARRSAVLGPGGASGPAARDGLTRVLSAAARPWRGRRRRAALALALGAAAAAAVAAAVAVPLLLDAGGHGGGAPSVKAHVLSEDFGGAADGWPVGTWPYSSTAVENGGYVVTQTAGPAYHAVDAPSGARPANVSVTATIRLRSGDPADEAGVFCRGDGTAGYEVLLDGRGAVVIRKGGTDGGPVLARSARPVAGPGRAVRLRATCQAVPGGVRVRAWAGGREAAGTVARPALPAAGTFGVVAGRPDRGWGTPATAAVFDGFAADRI
ncbi:hypothetical protein, partial [Actinomadura violacea]